MEKDEAIAEILMRYFRGSKVHEMKSVEEYIEYCQQHGHGVCNHDELNKAPDELIAAQLNTNEALRHKHTALDEEV